MIPETVQLPHVAFIGKAGAGKDTCAEILAELAGYERFAHADPLKDIAAAIWGEEARTDRAKLQDLGQKVREIEEDSWADLLVRRIGERQLDQYPRALRVAVTDCRYPNEAKILKEHGFVFVRVVASRNERVRRLKAIGKLQDEARLEHVSEVALDDFEHDFRVVNDGWTNDLANDLADILNRLAV